MSARARRLLNYVVDALESVMEAHVFDDDDLFDLTDDPFEWDMLLDDDELEQGRKKRQGKKVRDDASKKQDKRRRGLFGGLFG